MRALAVSLVLLGLVVTAAVVGTLGTGGDDADAADWAFAESMSQRRSYVAAAEIGGDIYAAGGMVGETGRPLDLLARYDPKTDSWETLRRMPEPTRAGAAAAVDGTLYVIGGSTVDGNTAAVYAYDPAADEWTEKAPLPGPRFNHSAVALDDGLGLAASQRARSSATSTSTTRQPTRGRRGRRCQSPTMPSTRWRSTARSG